MPKTQIHVVVETRVNGEWYVLNNLSFSVPRSADVGPTLYQSIDAKDPLYQGAIAKVQNFISRNESN